MTRWMIVAALLIAGCERPASDAPPVVRYGHDQCTHCGMILSDERFAAAMIVRREGENQTLLFDDIGDLLAYERDHSVETVVRRYVHDLDTREWIDAAATTFVVSESIHTPMGSGIAAFSEPSRAQAKREQVAGQTAQFASLVASQKR